MTTSRIKRAAIVAAIFVLSASTANAAEIAAKLSNVKGKVQVSSGAAWVDGKTGDSVGTNSQIRTGADGGCTVTWGGGHAFKMNPGTLIAIKTLTKDGAKETSDFSLTTGKVFAKARKMESENSSFSVKTPTAVAGVRGTEVAVSMVGDVSRFQVTEGLVGVELPGGEPVIIEPGFEVSLPEGVTEIPVPAPIPPVELQELKQNMSEVKAEAEASTKESSKESSKDTKAASKDSKEATKESSKDSKESSKEETKSSDKEASKDAAPSSDAKSADSSTPDAAPSAPDAGSSADSAVNSVNNVLQTNSVLETTQTAQNAAIDVGTVQVDIYIVKPQ